MRFKGKVIVRNETGDGLYTYEVISGILDYHRGDCIIVKSMDPDYSILLDQIGLIIAEKGSPLAHLAILAREYNKTILLIDGVTSKIPKKGKVTVSLENENAKIEIR